MLAGKFLHTFGQLSRFGPAEHTAGPEPIIVGGQHYPDSVFAVHSKDILKDPDHELHRRIFVIQERNLQMGRAVVDAGSGLLFGSG